MKTDVSDRPNMVSLIGGGSSESAEPPPFVWRNGDVVPWSDATIQIHDFIYAAPSIVFEGLKAYSGAGGLMIFRLDDHLDRFYDSMKMLRMRPAMNKDAVKAGVMALLRVPDAMAPPRVKAVANYYSWRLAYADAQAGGFDSLIMLGQSGKVSEGPGACVFLCRDGEVITPDTVSGILEGITRDTALTLLADELKLRVVERSVDRSEFYVGDEAFFAGTGLEIAAIASLDAIPIGDGEIGPITTALQSLYDDVVRGRKSGYQHWLTPLTGP